VRFIRLINISAAIAITKGVLAVDIAVVVLAAVGLVKDVVCCGSVLWNIEVGAVEVGSSVYSGTRHIKVRVY